MEYIKGQSNAWIDITGKKYNHLLVLGYLGNSKWNCKCDCGKEKIIKTTKITTGHTTSCGCIKKTNALKHGLTNTKEYHIWNNIKARCSNPNNLGYKNYGGRGIKICKEWEESFENFLKDMGNCPVGYSIERINNNKGYFKDNCKWASSKEQSLNRRSNNVITFNGEQKPLKQFCNELDKNYKKVFARITQLNWSIEDALTK